MKSQAGPKKLLLVLLVGLMLAALWLILITPPEFSNTHAVYQGF